MESQVGIYFAKRRIVLPGVYAEVNAENMVPNRGVPSRAVAIIARAQGGEVGGVTTITNTAQIRSKLIGGPGAHMVELAMAPSGEVAGTDTVHFIRVGNATPASINLGEVTLRATIAGRIGRGASVRRILRDGVSDLYLRHNYLNLEEQYLGLGPVLELRYEGSASVPIVEVRRETLDTVLTLTGTSTLELRASSVGTIANLIDEINATPEWSAAARGPLVGVKFEDLLPQSYTLAVDPDTGVGGRATLTIGGKAIEYALANSGIARATAQSDTGAVQFASWTYFTGGDDGDVVTVDDWQRAIDLTHDLNVHSIVLGTGDLAVLAAAKASVESLSDAKNRRERFLYVGANKAPSKQALLGALKEMAPGLASARVRIYGSEPRLVNKETNKLETYPSYYLAAMAAGMKAGNPPEMSLTNKQVAVFGTSYSYSVLELEELTERGICALTQDPATGNFTIVQGITSWTRDQNVIYRKDAGMDIHDYLNKGIRIRLQRFIGQTGDELLVSLVRDEVVSFLTEQVRSQTNRTGVLTDGIDPVTGEYTPAFDNVEVVMDGYDLVGVKYRARPVGEVAYITVTAFLAPTKIIATSVAE